MTLVELAVVIVVIGLLAGVSALAFRPSSGERPSTVDSLRDDARGRATRGREVTAPDGLGLVRFLPDGRALGQGVDPLTGASLGARR